MSFALVGYAIAVLGALGIFAIGIGYLTRPFAIARGFGLAGLPDAADAGWLNVKGVRDVTSGIVIVALAGAASQPLMATVVLLFAITPLGDGLTILRHHGSRRTAFTVHFSTAVALIVAAALLIV